MILAVALILGMGTSASAQGLVTTAAEREASAMQLSQAPRSGGNKGVMWGGIGMIAAGGTLAALGATALKNETCGAAVIGLTLIGGCIEETNKALLWTGIGIAGGGATLAAVGASKNVQIGFRRVAYRITF
jgi:hypothetical protein